MTVDGVVTPGIGDSTIVRVHWDWGDGNSEDRWLPASHTYTAYSEYTITVTAYQSDGLTSTKAFITDIPLVIPDSNLEAAIREAINKPEGSIYTSDLQPLTVLEAQERGILDLSGLEYCVNLEWLDLGENNISDISPLAGLTNLWRLNLNNNSISDISPLAGLTNLQGLTNLDSLGLYDNNISNISPLAGLTNLQGLTNLDSLGLYDNNVSDISPLAGLTNLRYLELQANNISDISALAGLTNLDSPGLYDNNVSDISPLVENSGLSDGDFVDLFNNPLSTTSVDVYIPQLEARGVTVEY